MFRHCPITFGSCHRSMAWSSLITLERWWKPPGFRWVFIKGMKNYPVVLQEYFINHLIHQPGFHGMSPTRISKPGWPFNKDPRNFHQPGLKMVHVTMVACDSPLTWVSGASTEALPEAPKRDMGRNMVRVGNQWSRPWRGLPFFGVFGKKRGT